ncbi:MAG: cysteine hydrolase [Proteobacteria bacterium]|nr:cysteine hydrolase [Pseudomonadota bacterium]
MELRTDKTALMVIDMQNAFCHPKGSLTTQRGFDTSALRGAVEPCRVLVEAARAISLPLIFTQYVYRADYADAGWRMREVTPEIIGSGSLAAGTWDADFVEGLKPQAHDIVVQKNRPSAFYSTPLESYLRSMAIESLVICGVTTNICVETTARDAGQRDYRTFVVADATAEMEPDRHDGALKALALMFARVLSVDEVLRAWSERDG